MAVVRAGPFDVFTCLCDPAFACQNSFGGTDRFCGFFRRRAGRQFPFHDPAVERRRPGQGIFRPPSDRDRPQDLFFRRHTGTRPRRDGANTSHDGGAFGARRRRGLCFRGLGGGGAVLGAAAFYFLVHLTGGTDSWGLRVFRRLPKISGFIDESRDFVRGVFRSRRIVKISALSLILWAVHVSQFYFFFQALGFQGPAIAILAYVPAAVFIGLLPVTIAGIGTRDLALILLFAPWAPAELMAGVALLSHLRYLLPGLVGIAFSSRYIANA
ncbi:MAG TPA: flippase-like domain-containing protein [Alphaproteobacteria bacterium]|nr:flippase-like domain-containing protein [Alphaproteobacteria bacterium]